MNIIKSRSPYFITIDEALQIEGKVELYLWHKGQTEPTTPTYTLSKLIPSVTQKRLDWNISNYINDFIDIINPVKVIVPTQENNDAWCFCKVKRYALLFFEGETEYSLLDTVTYIGVQGFTGYMDGLQVANETRLTPLFNPNLTNNYQIENSYSPNTIQYLNVLVDFKNINDFLEIVYRDNNGENPSGYEYDGIIGVYNFKIPISLAKTQSAFIDGCQININFSPNGLTPQNLGPIITYPICEPKYTPVLCDFINSFGGWQTLTFYKAQTNAINVKGSDYNLLPDSVDYNIYRGQSKVFNINGSQTVKLNTGWVSENYNELMRDLLLSEVVLLDNKPVKVKTQSLTYKTQLKDKMINFELDFEYAFDLINNIV